MHENWTINNWKLMILSDETMINKFTLNGRLWCWTEDRKQIGPQHVHQTMKHAIMRACHEELTLC
jgi:hypothetical protein